MPSFTAKKWNATAKLQDKSEYISYKMMLVYEKIEHTLVCYFQVVLIRARYNKTISPVSYV
jgi:hypothetical protein